MRRPRQARFSPALRLRFKRRLLETGITVTQVAAEIGRSRTAVSKAINQGRYPLVLAKIKEVLDVR